MKINELINLLFKTSVKNKNNDLPQEVDYKVALKCWYILAYMEIKTEEDVLLYLICMSLINGYVKQTDIKPVDVCSDEYIFKNSCLFKVLKFVNNVKCTNLKIGYNPREKFNSNVLFFGFDHLQFSFHGVVKEYIKMIPTNNYQNQVFNEVQNKKSSITLLDEVLKNIENFSNLTTIGSNLLESADSFLKEWEALDKKSKLKLCHTKIEQQFVEMNREKNQTINNYKWNNTYQKDPWELLGASGTPEQTRIFPYYIKYLESLRSSEGYLKGKTFIFTLLWEEQNPRQFANVLKTIYENGGRYTQNVKEANVFVKCNVRNDKWQLVDCPRLEYAKKIKTKINFISLDQFFDLIKTNQFELIKLNYPSTEWLANQKDEIIKTEEQKLQLRKEENAPDRNNPFGILEKMLFNK
ncbi:MAG: hypothetical protein ACOQNV_01035 [Mycoplasmoidaceae bacterium]